MAYGGPTDTMEHSLDYLIEQYTLAIAIATKIGNMSSVYIYARQLGHAVGASTLAFTYRQ